MVILSANVMNVAYRHMRQTVADLLIEYNDEDGEGGRGVSGSPARAVSYQVEY
jgi:hypothetical protein